MTKFASFLDRAALPFFCGIFVLTSDVTYAQSPSAPVADDAKDSPFLIASSARSYLTCAQWLPKLSAIGVTGSRMFPEWSWVQPSADQWKWTTGDAIIKSATDSHVEITAVLFGGVPWAHEGVHEFPVNNLDGWATYTSTAVNRYKDHIHYWEVWNEGNAGFNDNHRTTEDYAKIVESAYSAAKKADPTAQIGLSVASFDAPYLDHTFLAQTKDGKPNSFDYLCIHPYEVADGLRDPDGEIPYLGMTGILRQALKADAPDKQNAPIWITEVGDPLGKDVTETDAAKSLVKCYTMAIAEGIKRICWFEAQDPVGEPPGFGILAQDGLPRTSFFAMKNMIAALSKTPDYAGWLALGKGGKAYGFVYNGASGPVLVAWMPHGETDKTITFKGDVKITDSLRGSISTLKSGEPLTLTDTPVFILDLPADTVTQAHDHIPKNFPWGGDYSKSASVSLQLGPQPVSTGIMQSGRKGTPAYTFPDSSTGIKMESNAYATFYTHPSYATFKTSDYYIRITVRRIAEGDAGMNLSYEVANSEGQQAYKNKGEWFSLTADKGWQTHTWHVTDASFSKMWGYDFALHPDKTAPFVIGKVEVSTTPF